MTKRTRFPIVTPCEGCQAFADGRELFLTLDRLADREGLDPMRMARALRALLGLWTACAADHEQNPLPADEIEKLISETLREAEHSLRSYFNPDQIPMHMH